MEYEKIRQLIQDMENSKLSELNLEFSDGTKINMKKELIKENEHVKQTIENIEKEEKITQEIIEENCNVVVSPMVGTFYIKPSPNSAPYVEVGKEVKKGDILCIIEAMKLMNEIESEFSGKIVEILVKDGDAVEYGMPLFKIK